MQPHSRPRILVVDDVNLNRMMTAAVLGDLYEVDTVDDGHAALEALGRSDYDLVLMDLDMPGFSGYETASTFRQSPRTRSEQALIVAYSVASDAESVRRARGAGMDGHIARPIGASALKHEVSQFIRRTAVTERDPTPRVWVRERFEEIAERIGVGRSSTFLAGLIERLDTAECLLAGGSTMSTELKRQVHDLASVSGMFGFEEVFTICRSLQNDAAANAPDLARLGLALKRARSVILAELDTPH